MRFLLLCRRRKLTFSASSNLYEVQCSHPIISLGVGAPLPEKAADGSWNRTELSSNDKLRKQLLGRNYDKVMKAAAANKAVPGKQSGKTAASGTMSGRDEGSDDEEEEGRSALVGKKRTKGSSWDTRVVVAEERTVVGQVETGAEVGSTKEVPEKSASSKGRRKVTSYLDELLAERSKKRNKR